MCRSARSMSLPVPLALVVAGAALALATDVPALPALHCPPDATENQCLQHSSTLFQLNGSYYMEFTYKVYKTLGLQCIHDDVPLDEAETLRWLPRFTPALHVGNVTVTRCQNVHYPTVFAALNVTTTSPFNLEVYAMRRVHPESPAHFANLSLRHLTLINAGVLHDLPASLETLTVGFMELLDGILEALPRTLTELRLEDVGITRVPAAVLDLPELRLLHLAFLLNASTVERGNASRLQQLYVDGADAALMSDWAPPALEEVTLRSWQVERPNPLPACNKLVKLKLFMPKAGDLPAGWVARCPRLKELNIAVMPNLKKLPARLLENATQLTSFGIQGSNLSSLPAQLFADTPHLTHLDLSYNQFKQLPSSMLTLPLLSLNLKSNKLNASVVAELASLTELRSLSLVWNEELGDLCAVNDSNVTGHKMKSSLASLSKLERLDLGGTNISVICSDWREDMVNLEYLDLTYTNIRNLTYEDLQYKRSVPAVVKLSGRISFTTGDYDRAAAAAAVAPPSPNVTILLKSRIPDDCNYYRITKAFNGGLLPLHDLRILNKPPLGTVHTDFLFCDTKEVCAAVPSGCDCGMAPASDAVGQRYLLDTVC